MSVNVDKFKLLVVILQAYLNVMRIVTGIVLVKFFTFNLMYVALFLVLSFMFELVLNWLYYDEKSK